MPKKKVAIVGATGYTGSELVRLLIHHPQVEISHITSESYAGKKLSDVHGFFAGIVDYDLVSAEAIDNAKGLDLVFLALPHGVSMNYVKRWKDKDFKIVDFSGDYRLDKAETYEQWYNMDHNYTEAFKDAVYGMPELYREEIRKAKLVANPGCFPTGSILALSPLLQEKLLVPGSIVIDAKTGTTGAGVKPKPVTLFGNVNDNFMAYGLKKHRHTIEIETILGHKNQGGLKVQFTPHLLPVDRGILSTIYAKPSKAVDETQLKQTLKNYYADEKFIIIREQPPTLKDVRGTNNCHLYITFDERTGNIILITAIDNLVKGASGAALQNMNVMLGFEENTALNISPLNP